MWLAFIADRTYACVVSMQDIDIIEHVTFWLAGYGGTQQSRSIDLIFSTF